MGTACSRTDQADVIAMELEKEKYYSPLRGVPSSACDALPELRPSEIIGDWRSRFGIYTIRLTAEHELCFQESNLHGILQPTGEWYVAEVFESNTAGESYGFVRLKHEGKSMLSNFKRSLLDRWVDSDDIKAEKLPYLRPPERCEVLLAALACEPALTCAGVPSAIVAISDLARHSVDGCCCICLESFQSGDETAELTCHHVYHKSCIHQWFLRDTRCPLRCSSCTH